LKATFYLAGDCLRGGAPSPGRGQRGWILLKAFHRALEALLKPDQPVTAHQFVRQIDDGCVIELVESVVRMESNHAGNALEIEIAQELRSYRGMFGLALRNVVQKSGGSHQRGVHGDAALCQCDGEPIRHLGNYPRVSGNALAGLAARQKGFTLGRSWKFAMHGKLTHCG